MMSDAPAGDFVRHPLGLFRRLRLKTLIIAVPFVVGLIFHIWTAALDFQIADRQRSSEAVVIAHHPRDHNSYDLRLSIGNRSYTGRVHPIDEQIAVGQRVFVFFDPEDPQTMSLKSFSDKGIADLGPTAVLIAGIIFVLALSYSRNEV